MLDRAMEFKQFPKVFPTWLFEVVTVIFMTLFFVQLLLFVGGVLRWRDLNVDLVVARRVTLVAAFDFLPQNFGKWCEPKKWYTVILWMQVEWQGHCGKDTQTLPTVMRFV